MPEYFQQTKGTLIQIMIKALYIPMPWSADSFSSKASLPKKCRSYNLYKQKFWSVSNMSQTCEIKLWLWQIWNQVLIYLKQILFQPIGLFPCAEFKHRHLVDPTIKQQRLSIFVKLALNPETNQIYTWVRPEIAVSEKMIKVVICKRGLIKVVTW